MSAKKNASKMTKTTLSNEATTLYDTLDLIETNPDVKSYIYQQINELSSYVTPTTQVIVLARDPEEAYRDENHVISEHEESSDDHYKYRIALLLKEDDATLEAEGFGHDIYDAIAAAKDAMLQRLSEIQDEVESPQDRLNAIQQASDNTQLH